MHHVLGKSAQPRLSSDETVGGVPLISGKAAPAPHNPRTLCRAASFHFVLACRSVCEMIRSYIATRGQRIALIHTRMLLRAR